VVIADDESIVLNGLKQIINWNELGFHILGQAQNGEDALKKMITLQPDLVLLDIRMPKLYGTEVIKAARKSGFKGSSQNTDKTIRYYSIVKKQNTRF